MEICLGCSEVMIMINFKGIYWVDGSFSGDSIFVFGIVDLGY